MERLEKAVTRLESLFSDSQRSGGMECDAMNGVNGSKSLFLTYHLFLLLEIQLVRRACVCLLSMITNIHGLENSILVIPLKYVVHISSFIALSILAFILL